VVERHVANVAVVGSSPITRSCLAGEVWTQAPPWEPRILSLAGFLDFWREQIMTDEIKPDEEQEPETTDTVAEQGTEAGAEESEEAQEPVKLQQTVEMKDIGPCKKHIKVSIDRTDIDRLMNDKFSELVTEAQVAGFRPGKAPRKIVEKRYRKDVVNQVRGEVLLQSLEQMAEENDIAPLTPPNLDPAKLDIPESGPFVYEFDVEVRPQFDLPDYKGLKLKRPVKAFSDEDVLQEQRRLLARYGSLVPKDGPAEMGDYLIADMTTKHGDKVLTEHKEFKIRVDPRLAFKDGVAEDFGKKMVGARAGQTRTVDVRLLDSVADPTLRGQQVKVQFDIKDIKALRLPELTEDFLQQFGVRSEEQLNEHVRVILERRLEYQQRQSARQQVLGKIMAAGSWDLPQDLLQRQAKRAFNRRIMEMQSAGMSDEEIRGRLRLLERDVLQSTAAALKEHFVLQKVAEVEKLDIDEADIDDEIERMAALNDESPRRVRARLEKEDLMEALAIEIVERKALDLILENAEYEDVPLEKEEAVATVEEQTVPGTMQDPTAAPAEEEASAEEKKAEQNAGEK
jgi:trigger factor